MKTTTTRTDAELKDIDKAYKTLEEAERAQKAVDAARAAVVEAERAAAEMQKSEEAARQLARIKKLDAEIRQSGPGLMRDFQALYNQAKHVSELAQEIHLYAIRTPGGYALQSLDAARLAHQLYQNLENVQGLGGMGWPSLR